MASHNHVSQALHPHRQEDPLVIEEQQLWQTLKTNRGTTLGEETVFKKPLSIVVEGNIGSGKTTFLNTFQGKDVEIMTEPVEKWRNAQGHNLLDLMYSDPKRWGFLFQSYVQLTMLQDHIKPCFKPVKMMERSLGRRCFIENLYTHGNLSEAEHVVLLEWFNFLNTCKHLECHIDLIIYLRTSPEAAFERLQKRSRHEENKVTFEYIKALHELHEDWLLRRIKFQPLSAPVMVIDANEDLETLSSTYTECKSKILGLVDAVTTPVFSE